MKKRAYGTYEIADICDVTPSTVGNWIEKKLLPTFTTGGGHRRVWAEDLLKFLSDHNIPIPDKLKDENSEIFLIVDDEENVRKLASRVIKKHYSNAEIFEAVDGYEAGQKLARLVPSLVILDIRLPGIDGFKVCENIRNEKRLRPTKILAISGHNTDDYSKKALSSGADDFLGKPFTSNELFDRINKLIAASKKIG